MDFFSAQDKARTQTRRLILLYFLAVLALTGISHAVGVGILAQVLTEHTRHSHNLYWELFFRPDLFISFSALIGLIVVTGTVTKMFSLRQGGAVVARDLGGQELSRHSSDQLEIRLLNIVEEMAIASGTPIPRIFLLNRESGINAFAAGHTLDDAAIGVTRGAIEKLNREQLQGVIAHEFSHILNADMRLNIRLIGVLNGILCIFLLGRTILQILSDMRPRRRSRSSDNEKNPLAVLYLAAIALVIIGSLGAFFARMIQSAISRQREFLADSSAVQFTRNPEGLAGALQTISTGDQGSLINHPRATEVEHLFFSDGVSGFLASLFATHPPLSERIKRLVGRLVVIKEETSVASGDPVSRIAPAQSSPDTGASQPLVASIGTISSEQITQARGLIDRLPQALVTATRDLQGAQCIVAGLMLSADLGEREKQLPLITTAESPLPATEVLKLAPLVGALPVEARLAVLDLAVVTLRKLTPRQYTPLHTLLNALADVDQQLTLAEYLILTILKHSVEPLIFSTAPSRLLISNRQDLAAPLAVVLSALAMVNVSDTSVAREQFSRVTSQLNKWPTLTCANLDQISFSAIDQTLDTLAKASPTLKREIVEACSMMILADRHASPQELELFRAVCAALGCPVPLLRAEQSS